MKVTESRFKNRQLHIEDYLQMVSAEQKEHAEVFAYGKITEKSGISTDYWTNNLMDMDLEKFFDTVSQSKLIEVLGRTIKDGRVISLIHKYLGAGVIANGMFERTGNGMPQGGSLSPLLSNVMLNELDEELERRENP